MRILIACGASRRREGGVAGVVLNLSAALRALGHSVDAWFYEDLLPRRRLPRRFETVELAFAIARKIRERRADYDVVNVHAPYGFVYGASRRFRGAAAGPPYVMTMHGLEERRIHAMSREARKGRAWHFRRKNRLWHRVYHMPTYRYSILTADSSITLNREAWICLQMKYRRDAGRAWCIPNGVGTCYFLAREYAASPALRLLYVGTWIDHKGVYYLRDGFAALAGHRPELRLTIAGCLVDSESVKRFFPEGVRDRVDVVPFVPAEQMPALYARHDIFVFPSLVEGMPLVLLEAMATAMPVVTTDTCGMADVLEDGYNGLLVKPADSEGFAAAVLRLIESRELRAQLGRAAQETMRRYRWDTIARRVERVFALAATNAKGG